MSLKKFFEQFEKTEDDKSEFVSRGNYNENLSKEQAGLKQTEMKEAWDEKQEISEGGSSKTLRSTEISPGINVSKKRKEGSPFGKTNKTDDDDDRGDMEAMLQSETPAWAKHPLLEITEVKRTVIQISDLRSELTKLINSFISFKTDIQFRVNEMDKAVNLFSNKYDEIEKANRHLEERVIQLESEKKKLSNKVSGVLEDLDDIQQYSRRNCLLVHGLKEDKDESTNDLVLKLFNEKLGVAVDISMIDRSHRLGPVRGENNPKPRPVIVKFCSYRIRRAVFTTKRKLKGSGVSVTESFTKQRMKLLNEVQKVVGKGNSWTVDGFIFVKHLVQLLSQVNTANQLMPKMTAT